MRSLTSRLSKKAEKELNKEKHETKKETVEITVSFFRGPGGNRTRVRKPVPRGISHHSCFFTFPQLCGRQQPHSISSFIIRPQAQSFACVVSRNHDAGNREYGYNRADEQQLRLLLQLYCCQRLILSSGFNAVRPADGFLDFETPVETSTSPYRIVCVAYYTSSSELCQACQ